MSEEANQRIIRHLINCSKHYARVDALTIDTDVLKLVISSYPLLKSINHSVLVLCGTGLGTASVDYYNVEVIGNSQGEEVCKTLPFFTHSRDVTLCPAPMGIENQNFATFG